MLWYQWLNSEPAMIHKMANLKIKTPYPFKKKISNSFISIRMDTRDLGRWVSIYFRKFSAWVIDFMAHPDDQEQYLSVLKRKLFKKYRESWLNGKWIFLCNVIQHVLNSEEILVNAAELKCGLRNKKGILIESIYCLVFIICRKFDLKVLYFLWKLISYISRTLFR